MIPASSRARVRRTARRREWAMSVTFSISVFFLLVAQRVSESSAGSGTEKCSNGFDVGTTAVLGVFGILVGVRGVRVSGARA